MATGSTQWKVDDEKWTLATEHFRLLAHCNQHRNLHVPRSLKAIWALELPLNIQRR